MPRNRIHGALRRGPHPEHGPAARRDLRAARVGDHLGRHAEPPCPRQQAQQLLLTLDLHRDLGLAQPLPLPQDLRLGGLRARLGGA